VEVFVANLEKHQKHLTEELEFADFSDVPTCARSSHLIGHYIKNRHKTPGRKLVAGSSTRDMIAGVEGAANGVVLRLDSLPVTPAARKRLERRVADWNHEFSQCGVPVRFRMR
jgi:hypothetical protein